MSRWLWFGLALASLFPLVLAVPVEAEASDTSAPVFSSATVNGTSLVLTYDEDLDTDSVPDNSAYTITVGGNAATATSSISISDSTITLTLAAAVTAADTVTVAYTVPADNPVQDRTGNDAAALRDESVVNDTPLVSNLGQGPSSIRSTGQTISQTFTTGCHPAGYSLSSVQVHATTKGSDFTAGLYMTQFDGGPGTYVELVHSLSLPSDLSSGVLTFTAPADATLEPNTRYSFVIAIGLFKPDDFLSYHVTHSDDEDSGKTAGWSMADDHRILYGYGLWVGDRESRAARIAVNGAPIEDTDGTDPTDQTWNTGTPLVSNLGQETHTFDANPRPRSQIFTTGCHPAGYNLSSVQLRVRLKDHDATVGIYPAEEDGSLGELVHALSLPSDLSGLTKTFTAPANATLESRTRYAVVIDPGPGKKHHYMHYYGTFSADEDIGKAEGWSIDNFYLVVGADYWSDDPHYWRQDHHFSPGRLAVNGSPITAAATGRPTIAGTPQVGETLAVSTADIADADGNSKAEQGEEGYGYTHRWVRVDG